MRSARPRKAAIPTGDGGQHIVEQTKLMDTHVQVRKVYNLLGEILDLSQQLAQAVDREDQISVQMLLAMREEPIRKLLLTRQAIQQQLASASQEDAQRLRALLDGSPAKTSQEEPLAKQVAANIRLLKRVQEMEQPLNQKICRDKSMFPGRGKG